MRAGLQDQRTPTARRRPGHGAAQRCRLGNEANGETATEGDPGFLRILMATSYRRTGRSYQPAWAVMASPIALPQS